MHPGTRRRLRAFVTFTLSGTLAGAVYGTLAGLVSTGTPRRGAFIGIIHGTACQSPVVKWWLSADDTCNFGSPDYFVGSRTPTLCSGTPALLHPNPYDFTGVPAGDYKLCAYIDPDDLISETNASDSDNDLGSEALVTILDCP